MLNELYQNSIVVVGQAVHTAGGVRSGEELFELLKSCRNVASTVPPGRFSTAAFGFQNPDGAATVDQKRGKTDAPFGYFCDDVATFDTSPNLFGLSPTECKHVDPQQRQLLLLTSDAIRNAGMSLADMYNTNTGVYIGNMNRDYQMLMTESDMINQYSSQGSASAIAANRISFAFHLRGVSIAVDSACSATGIGVHFACNDLREGNIDMALVGGFNLIVTPYNFIGLSQLQVLSRVGKTHAFDESADGYTRGEGGGVVLLKRYEDAVRDGNRILGVIATSATCSNGRSVGAMAAPSLEGQLDMFRRTFTRAARRGIKPCDIQYVECHGTGTHRGDAVEVNACGDFLFKHTSPEDRPGALHIGSVKANVGHLEAAACIPSIVKVLKCLEHQLIPKQINYEKPNKEVNADYVDKLRVPREHTPWRRPTSGKPRMAIINSYGYGGSIAQLIVVEYVDRCAIPRNPTSITPALVVWGHTKSAVQQRKQLHRANLLQFNTASSSLAQYCLGGSLTSNNTGGFMSVASGSTPEELAERLKSAAVVPVAQRPQAVCLVFPGQGSQHDTYPPFLETAVYRATLCRVEDWLQRTEKPYSILAAENLTYKNSWPLSMQSLYIFAHEIALGELLLAAVPQLAEQRSSAALFVGHSLGEYAVAFLTKELSLVHCCEAVWGIGETLEPLRGRGYMAEISTVKRDELGDVNGVDVGCINSPDRVIMSGPTDAMDVLVKAGATRIPHVEFPFHSNVMDERKDAVQRMMERIGVPVERWWENIRGCVKFAAKLNDGGLQPSLYVEVGQQTSLGPSVVRTTGVDCICAATHLLKALFAFKALGYRVQWREILGHLPLLESTLIPLPLHLEPHWFEPMRSFRSRMGADAESLTSVLSHLRVVPSKGKPEDVPALALEGTFNPDTFPLLADHVYNKASLVPGTFWVEMFTSTARSIVPASAGHFRLRDIEFKTACYTPAGQDTQIRVAVAPVDQQTFEATVSSRPSVNDSFVVNARCVIEFHPQETLASVNDRARNALASKYFGAECDTGIHQAKEDWYVMFRDVGFDFGERFRLLELHKVLSVRGQTTPLLGLGTVKHRVAVDLALNDTATGDFASWPYEVHPGLIDAATQGMAVRRSDGKIASSLPWKVGEVVHFGAAPCRQKSYVALLEVLDSAVDVEVAHCLIYASVLDDNSGSGEATTTLEPVVLLRNFTCKVVDANASHADQKGTTYYEMGFVEQEMMDKSKALEWNIVLLVPELPDCESATDLAYEVASRMQRSVVLRSVGAMTIPESGIPAKAQSVALAVFLPSPGAAMVAADPVSATYRFLTHVLALLQQVQSLSMTIPNLHVVLFTSLPCLSELDTGTGDARVALARSIVGAFRSVVVEHGELRARLVEYALTDDCVGRICDEIKFAWQQPKLESHVILKNSRQVGVYDKIHLLSAFAASAPARLAALTQGAWLIAGGCGAMGLRIAAYLTGIGARKVFLGGRKGVRAEDKPYFDTLPKGTVEVIPIDITSATDLLQKLRAIQDPPVLHVVHLAMVLNDRLIRSVTPEDIVAVGGPKIAGAWNLHCAEQQLPHKFATFLTMSSTTALVGTPGQFVYGSGNCFMDGLIAVRRSLGLAGSSIQLGPVSGIGFLAREEGTVAKTMLERSGWIPHTPDVLLNIVTDVLIRGSELPPVVSPLQINEHYFQPDHRTWKSYERLMSYFAVTERAVAEASLEDALAVVKRILAQELRYSEDSIQPETSLNNLGVTSMVQNILALAIQENFSGVSIPQRFFLSPEVTPLAIAKEIITRLAKLKGSETDAGGANQDVVAKEPPKAQLVWSSGTTALDALNHLQRCHALATTENALLAECVLFSDLLPFRGAILSTAPSAALTDVVDQRSLQKPYRAVFVFPGQGTQFVGMARPLYDTIPLFHHLIETLIGFISDRPYGEQLRDLLLNPASSTEKLNQTKFTQPALFVFEVALGRLLLDAGLEPIAVGGHSVGEIAAKTVIGELTLRDGVTLTVRRALEMSTRGHGKMAAVLMTERELKSKLAEWGSRVHVGAINGPNSCVVSGDTDAVDRFVASCKSNGVKVVPLTNAHAFHSPKMSEAKAGVMEALSALRLYPTAIPATSNLTGDWSSGQDTQFYIDQIDHCVQWDSCADKLLEKLRAEGDRCTPLCVEVGPGLVLNNLMKKKLASDDEVALRQACAGTDPAAGLLATIADLWRHVPSFNPTPLFAPTWHAHRRVTITCANTWLGIHCVAHMLRNSNCVIVLPLRAPSPAAKRALVQEACDKFGVTAITDSEVKKRIIFIDTDEFDDDATDVIHVTTAMNSLADYESVKEANVLWPSALAERCIRIGAVFHYVSTLACLWGIEQADESTLPPLEKAWMAKHTGVTQSKIVMEHKLRTMAAKKGLKYCVYRIDMLGGSSTTGAVGPNSYYTSLLRTVLRTKRCSSHMFGPSPRVTVDEAAAQILTLAGATHRFPATFHITTGKELFSIREFAIGFETVPFEDFRQSMQLDAEQPFLSLIDTRSDRHAQTSIVFQKTAEALAVAHHQPTESNSTRLAATVRRWLEAHE